MQYWQLPDSRTSFPIMMEFRGALARELIHRFGIIAGHCVDEDSQGRAATTLQEPKDLVDRCCEIADLFVSELERRGWVHVDERTPEEYAEYEGSLRRIRSDAEYPAGRWGSKTADKLEKTK